MYSAISKNKRNTVIIMAVFLLLIGGLGWIAGMAYQDYSITIIVLVVALLYSTIQYFTASKTAIILNGGREITKKDCPELWNIVENLAISEGMPMPRVFIIDDPAPNAFATGRDPKHAYVAATTGILDIMTKRELNAVMAHEMSHVKNYDIRVNMIVFGLVGAISFIADMLLRMSFYSDDKDQSSRNGVFMLIGVFAAIIAPIVALLTQLAISRQREYLADASGALTTRDPEALADALEKLKSNARPMRRQNTATAHLFFNNPMKSGFLTKLFSTHPPLDDRIARLRSNINKM